METVDLSISLAILFLALAVYYHLKIFTFWRSRGIPGPAPWPVFGTNIYYCFETKIELETKWRDKYGKIYGLFEGYSPVLFVGDAELIKEIYVKKFQSFMDHNVQYIHQDNQKRWLVWSTGSYWANLRALITPMFTASKVRTALPTMSACVDRFIEQVDGKNANKRRASGDKQSLPSYNKNDLSVLTLDVIASSFFGLKLDPYSIKGQQEKFIKEAYKYADFEQWRYILWVIMPRQIATLFKFDLFGPKKYKYFDELTQRIVGERRRHAGPKRSDVVQALIDAKFADKDEKVFSELDDKEAHYNARTDSKQLELIQREQSKEPSFKSLNDLEIRSLMTSFFVAGFETTASTLSFALYEIAHQPEIQEKVLQELRESFGQGGEKLKHDDHEKNYSSILNLKYLDAFLSEVLRIYSPVIEVSRVCTDRGGASVDINGRPVHLPYGTGVIVNSFVVQRDPDYFDRPTEFDVTRFCSPEKKDSIKTGTYLPFGIGPRYCIGMRFALLEMKLSLAKLLLRYRIVPDEATQYPPKFKQNAQFLQLKNSNFVLVPRES